MKKGSTTRKAKSALVVRSGLAGIAGLASISSDGANRGADVSGGRAGNEET